MPELLCNIFYYRGKVGHLFKPKPSSFFTLLYFTDMKPLPKKETGSGPKLLFNVRSAHADMNHVVTFTAQSL